MKKLHPGHLFEAMGGAGLDAAIEAEQQARRGAAKQTGKSSRLTRKATWAREVGGSSRKPSAKQMEALADEITEQQSRVGASAKSLFDEWTEQIPGLAYAWQPIEACRSKDAYLRGPTQYWAVLTFRGKPIGDVRQNGTLGYLIRYPSGATRRAKDVADVRKWIDASVSKANVGKSSRLTRKATWAREVGRSSKGATASLWRFNRSTSTWERQRSVTPDTAARWLNTFERNEPNEAFMIFTGPPPEEPSINAFRPGVRFVVGPSADVRKADVGMWEISKVLPDGVWFTFRKVLANGSLTTRNTADVLRSQGMTWLKAHARIVPAGAKPSEFMSRKPSAKKQSLKKAPSKSTSMKAMERLADEITEYLWPEWYAGSGLRGDLTDDGYTLHEWLKDATSRFPETRAPALDELPEIQTLFEKVKRQDAERWAEFRPKILAALRQDPKANIVADGRRFHPTEIGRLGHEGAIRWSYYLSGWEVPPSQPSSLPTLEGRKVRFRGGVGTVIKWEPLTRGGTDALVRFDHPLGHGRAAKRPSDGDVWVSSHELTPADGLGPLPSKRDAVERERAERRESLLAIRSGLVREVEEGKPWPGAEHGKVLLGRAIDAAIEETSPRKPSPTPEKLFQPLHVYDPAALDTLGLIEGDAWVAAQRKGGVKLDNGFMLNFHAYKILAAAGLVSADVPLSELDRSAGVIAGKRGAYIVMPDGEIMLDAASADADTIDEARDLMRIARD